MRLNEVLAERPFVNDKAKEIIDEFPYKPLDDGRCEMLNDDMTCRVYDDRPDLCNVERFGKRAVPYLPPQLHFAVQEAGCKSLMRKNNYTEEEIKKIYNEKD